MEIKYTLDDIGHVAGEFIKNMGVNRVFAFQGDMGAGKTTLISEVCRLLECADDTGSPTFNLVNEYLTGDGETVYHFDFYRIESIGEALDMGIEDYFYSGRLCFLEWPEKIEGIIPEDAVRVTLKVNADGSRTLSF